MIKAVFYGASSVEGAGATEIARRFSSLTAHALGWEEVNLGIGGTTVVGRDAEGQVTDENSGLGRVTDVLDAHPDVVLISYGSNDFARNLPVGAADKFEQGTFFWDYDTMIRGLLSVLHPGQIVLSTLQYRVDAETPNALGLTLSAYNDAVQKVGARHELRVLDAYADAGMDSDNWSKLSDDGIHPNDAGHECLAAFFIQALQSRKSQTGS